MDLQEYPNHLQKLFDKLVDDKYCHEVQLDPMSRDDAKELVKQRFAVDDVDSQLARQLWLGKGFCI